MNISYSIMTHNEDESLLKLINFITENKDDEDEIVILDVLALQGVLQPAYLLASLIINI